MNLRTRLPWLIGACVAAGLSACGSSNASSSSTTAPASPPTAATSPAPAGSSAAASTLKLAADPTGQLAYVQKSLTAKAGKVTIDFSNASPVGHDVAVASGSSQLGVTPVGTGSSSLTLTLAKGTYTYYCTVPGHRMAGMQGTLTVN